MAASRATLTKRLEVPKLDVPRIDNAADSASKPDESDVAHTITLALWGKVWSATARFCVLQFPFDRVPRNLQSKQLLTWSSPAQIALAMLFWGVGVFFMTYSSYLDPRIAIGTSPLCFGAGIVLATLPYIAVYNKQFHRHWPGKPHIAAFLGGFSSAAGNFGYLELTAGSAQASILAPMSSCYLLIPVFVGICFWKDRWSVQKLVGIASAVGGVILLALSPETKFSIDAPSNLGWFIMVFVTWGSASCLYMLASDISTILLAILYLDLGYFSCTYLVTAAAYNRDIRFHWTTGELVMLFGGLLVTCGTNTYIVIVRTYREASTISPLGSLYVMLPVILGIAILGESINTYKIIGAVVSCCAILLLSTTDIRQLLVCFPKRTARVVPLGAPMTSIHVRPHSAITGIPARPITAASHI